MKPFSPTLGTAALLALGLASPGRAQDVVNVRSSGQRPPTATRTIALSRPAWLEKVIDLNIKNERPADAIKRIVKQAGKTVENVELDEGLADVRLSLSVRGVKVGDALAAVGRIGGAVASVADRDDRVTVYLKKRNERVAMLSEMPAMGSLFVGGDNAAAFPKETRIEIERALADAGRTIERVKPQMTGIARTMPPFASFTTMFAKLPDKRVSIDLKKVEIREALKKILGDAGVAYALDDDLPTDASRSFTFENVPLGTALELICASAGIGWRAEKTDDKGGVLVKVGKKYLGNGGRNTLFGGLSELPGEIRTIISNLPEVGEPG